MINKMVSLYYILKELVFSERKIDTNKLPSQGLFYKDDFTISIKKVNLIDIQEYERNFIKDNLHVIIQKVKDIVEKNIILSEGYIFEDIKSIDVVFLFLEIVKYTTGSTIEIFYTDEQQNKQEKIYFDQKFFNYYKLSEEIMNLYNSKEKCFKINGYSYTLPSIGVENSLTYFLIEQSFLPNSEIFEKLIYDFTYFVGDKNFLTFDEIENLIQIFNQDLDKNEIKKIKEILQIFSPLQRYSLIKEGREIDINSKIDLENIWKQKNHS